MSDPEKYEKIRQYIYTHPIAVLGTVGEDGAPHGAAIYICPDEQRHIVYFLTKNETQKYKNLTAHETVSLTIVDPADNSTLQASGKALTTREAHALNLITRRLAAADPEASEWVPPVTKLHAGQYVAVAVTLTRARLTEFQGLNVTAEHMFTAV